MFIGELFPSEAASGSEDEGDGEARKGVEACQGRDSDVEHRVHVHRSEGRGCEERSREAPPYFPRVHEQRREDRAESPSREALASHWLGSDSGRDHHRRSSVPHLNLKTTRNEKRKEKEKGKEERESEICGKEKSC